jgi:hypothetical protein
MQSLIVLHELGLLAVFAAFLNSLRDQHRRANAVANI